MNKFDLAEYLVNLNILIQAQTAIGVNASSTLVGEYNRSWEELKHAIREDQDETGQSPSGRASGLQDGTKSKEGEPSGRRPVG